MLKGKGRFAITRDKHPAPPSGPRPPHDSSHSSRSRSGRGSESGLREETRSPSAPSPSAIRNKTAGPSSFTRSEVLSVAHFQPYEPSYRISHVTRPSATAVTFVVDRERDGVEQSYSSLPRLVNADPDIDTIMPTTSKNAVEKAGYRGDDAEVEGDGKPKKRRRNRSWKERKEVARARVEKGVKGVEKEAVDGSGRGEGEGDNDAGVDA
ncbi:hypothetical protein VTL71DRAFT_15598 [Oculimacula yallundae]|uniref:Uncharacterized protein n=1 Tax=Oculimacula yallundae TaxID=86028 RepID=A0ABR4CH25_9HELO